jgi:hypothetical protein
MKPLLLAIAVWGLAGCGGSFYWNAHPSLPGGRPAGLVAVVPVVRDEANRVVAEGVARLFARDLNDRWGNVVERDWLLRAAESRGTVPQVTALLAARHPETPGPDLARFLRGELGIHALMVTDLFEYDQVWGSSTKLTRVGVEVVAFYLPGGEVLWRGRYTPEVEGKHGRSFQVATEMAVRGLVEAVDAKRTEQPSAASWLYWWWRR